VTIDDKRYAELIYHHSYLIWPLGNRDHVIGSDDKTNRNWSWQIYMWCVKFYNVRYLQCIYKLLIAYTHIYYYIPTKMSGKTWQATGSCWCILKSPAAALTAITYILAVPWQWPIATDLTWQMSYKIKLLIKFTLMLVTSKLLNLWKNKYVPCLKQ